MFAQVCYNHSMKHCEHCRIEKHFHLFQAKKVGIFGVVFMGLHLLFHVFELLILPSALVLFGGHLAEEPATATSKQTPDIMVTSEHAATHALPAPCVAPANFSTSLSSWTCTQAELRPQTVEQTE